VDLDVDVSLKSRLGTERAKLRPIQTSAPEKHIIAVPRESMAMEYEIGTHPSGSHWFAVWTRSRQEKSAAAMLSTLGVTHFLPLISQIHQWSDRKQTVTVPLFNGYLFVYMNLARDNRLKVLNTSGIVGLVGNQTGPLPIPEQQIEDIRTILDMRVECVAVPLLNEGDRVRVLRGPLAGIEGKLVRTNSSTRLSISIESIHKSLLVNVSRGDVELLQHLGATHVSPKDSRDFFGISANRLS
jgi:transcription antitermination factor NusG